MAEMHQFVRHTRSFDKICNVEPNTEWLMAKYTHITCTNTWASNYFTNELALQNIYYDRSTAWSRKVDKIPCKPDYVYCIYSSTAQHRKQQSK